MPPTAEPTNAPAAQGAVVRAECQGVKPRPFCRNTLKIITMPPSEATNTIENTMPGPVRPVREDGQLDQRGPARALAADLVTAKAASSSTDAAEHAEQPGRPAQRVPLRQREDQAEHGHPGQHRARQVQPRRAAPAAAAGASAGRNRAPSTSAASPTGTLTRKIIRQPAPNRSAAISPPAAIGPSMADRPITGP